MNYSQPLSYWQSASDLPHLSADDLPAAATVAVVGGGLLGVATAYWLARAGLAPVLVERGPLADGATGRNGGLMVPGTAEGYPDAIARLGHADARAIWALTEASVALLRATLAEEGIACGYETVGHLSLALDEAALGRLRLTVEALRADGFAAELLDREAAAELAGTPLADEVLGAKLLPGAGKLHSARLVLGLAAAARARGAHLCPGVAVEALAPAGDGVQLLTSGGPLAAGAVVVAANAWLGGLVPALARLITPVRGQALAYEPIPYVMGPGMGAAITGTGEYWQQTRDGSLVIGGCRALAPGRDVGRFEREPTPEVQAGIEAVLPRLFPQLGPLRVARRWGGTMAFTADYLPIVGRDPEAPIYFVGGFSGHGMPFGMGLGRLLAESVSAGALASDLAPLRPDRPTLAP